MLENNFNLGMYISFEQCYNGFNQGGVHIGES